MIVVVNGYNCQKTADQCIRSVFNQTKTDFTLIVVDDCSDDRTDLVIDRFTDDSRVISLRTEINGGAAYARWTAMKMIKALNVVEPVVWIDMDDYLCNDKALEIVQEKYDGGAEVTYGNIIYPKGHVSGESYTRDADFRSEKFVARPLRSFSAAFINGFTEDFFQLDGQWIRKCTDMALMIPVLCAADKEKICYIHEVLYYYNWVRPEKKKSRMSENRFARGLVLPTKD